MYTGTIVPLITPLDHAGDVSPTCVARLIDSLRGSVSALMPALSSGEGFALTDRQWHDMVTATRANSRGLPVLAGIQLPDTAAVVRRAAQAVVAGVDGVVVTTPFGRHITQDRIYEHFATVRAAVEVPLFVYNEAAVSGNHIELATLVRVCRLPGVAGLKESSGSPELTAAIATAVPRVPVFEGWEHLLAEARSVAGFIGPLANLEPELCNAMLADPSAEQQAEINDACTRYGLLAEDWYRSVKTELVARGMIDTERLAGPRRPFSGCWGAPQPNERDCPRREAGHTVKTTVPESDFKQLFRYNRSVHSADTVARLEELEHALIVPLVISLEADTPELASRAQWVRALNDLLGRDRAESAAGEYLAERASREEFRAVVHEFALDGLTEAQNFFPVITWRIQVIMPTQCLATNR